MSCVLCFRHGEDSERASGSDTLYMYTFTSIYTCSCWCLRTHSSTDQAEEVIDDALFSLQMLVTDDASIEDFVCLGGLQVCVCDVYV